MPTESAHRICVQNRRMIPRPIRADARYRVVDEARIIDLLVLSGWAHEVRLGERASSELQATATLERWIAAGLPYTSSTDRSRRFDPVEVVNFLKLVGLRDRDPFLEEHFIATGRRMVLDFHGLPDVAGALPSPRLLQGRRFIVTLQREFDLRGASKGSRTLLRLPLPLEDDALSDLKIEPFAPPDTAANFTVGLGRLDARVSGTLPSTLALGVQLSFTAYPSIPSTHPTTLAATDIELYTRPNEGLIRVSPRIRALAAELAGSETDTLKVVHRNWTYILDELTCGVLHYDELDPAHPTDWPLETGWFDCQVGSALLIALCRAQGIPSRLVSGYQLYSAIPSPHYWSEIWSDACGWLPLDLICADLSVRGRDAPWRDYFFGLLDYRMKTQCLPRLFNQNPSMPFPAAWHMLARVDGKGIEVGFFENDSGTPVYRDRISVLQEACVPEALP
jgi:Transglutaminase-like superfamily